MSKIKFILDGKEVSAEANKTIVSIAAENGIHIPTLCHNEKVSRTTFVFCLRG